MLFKRYASPFIFLNALIENHALKQGLANLLEQVEEEKLYDFYLANVANPLAEIDKTFDEWKRELYKPISSGLNKEQVNTAVNKANNVLNNFVPQKKKGA